MKKVPVGILGATGCVGQHLARLLKNHPWFELTAAVASQDSVGKPFENLTLLGPQKNLPCRLLFSALDPEVADPLEKSYAERGYTIISTTRAHRMQQSVPLIVPEVNAEILKKPSSIICTPNCSATGIALALKPLEDAFGIDSVHIVTMQALSGAGRGAKALDITDNVIPYIREEEEKIEEELPKILGKKIPISAHCNRVAVSDGHTACISIKFTHKPTSDEIITAWQNFTGSIRELPSAPKRPLHYLEQVDAPQPKHHRDREQGMAVSLGRLRPCALFDYKFALLSHNAIRGAAGGALLTAESYLAYNQ